MSTIVTAKNLTRVTSALKKFVPINDKDHRIEKNESLLLETKRETLILFGNPKDPEIAQRINKAYLQGYKVEMQARPSFDTGLGPCGKHLCQCKTVCLAEYAKDITL